LFVVINCFDMLFRATWTASCVEKSSPNYPQTFHLGDPDQSGNSREKN